MRIISMFGIIILHILGAGGNLRGEADSLNYWVVWFLEIMAYCLWLIYLHFYLVIFHATRKSFHPIALLNFYLW